MTKPAGQRAAERVRKRHDLCINVPGLGTIDLGPPDQLAYLAGIATLAALEIIEWPLACIIAAGHVEHTGRAYLGVTATDAQQAQAPQQGPVASSARAARVARARRWSKARSSRA